jgi:hypothetical protein
VESDRGGQFNDQAATRMPLNLSGQPASRPAHLAVIFALREAVCRIGFLGNVMNFLNRPLMGVYCVLKSNCRSFGRWRAATMSRHHLSMLDFTAGGNRS